MELAAKKVSFRYGKKGAFLIENVNLTIKSGEVVGLMARSGYGKTTLCKLLAGYEKPVEGEVLLEDKPLSEKTGYCPVQMIWQHAISAVDPKLRMKDILKEGGEVSGELLEKLGVQEAWMKRFPAELSGGELQRFCIARALGRETKFLLADEITAMLDYVSQCQIWNFLMDTAAQRGIGILAVSHNLELLNQVCTRIVQLDQPQEI